MESIKEMDYVDQGMMMFTSIAIVGPIQKGKISFKSIASTKIIIFFFYFELAISSSSHSSTSGSNTQKHHKQRVSHSTSHSANTSDANNGAVNEAETIGSKPSTSVASNSLEVCIFFSSLDHLKFEICLGKRVKVNYWLVELQVATANDTHKCVKECKSFVLLLPSIYWSPRS